jgi:hypothetical protein
MTRARLRKAIAFHRTFHRPELFAALPGSIQECQLPSCLAVMGELYAAGWDPWRRS